MDTFVMADENANMNTESNAERIVQPTGSNGSAMISISILSATTTNQEQQASSPSGAAASSSTRTVVNDNDDILQMEDETAVAHPPRNLTSDQDFANATAHRPHRRNDNASSTQNDSLDPTQRLVRQQEEREPSGVVVGAVGSSSSELPAHMLESVLRLQQRLPPGARIVLRHGRPSFQIIQSSSSASTIRPTTSPPQSDGGDHSDSYSNGAAGGDDPLVEVNNNTNNTTTNSTTNTTTTTTTHTTTPQSVAAGELRGRLTSAATFRPPRIQLSTPHLQRSGLGRGGGIGYIGGPTRIQFRTIPPLEPSILIDDQQCFRKQQVDEITRQVDLERFLCAICYEFMDQPATCGRCPARFCRSCLARVWSGLGGGSSSSTDNNNSILMQHHQQDPQCPTCRQPLHAVQADIEFKNELDQQDPIPCRYNGCNEMLPLTDIKHHEAVVCTQVRVACRYRSFGCKWLGPRAILTNHEEFQCPYTKISVLVESHRTTREHFQQGFRQLEDRVGALGAVLDHYLEFTRRQDEKSLSNPIDLLSFIVAVTCSTPQFFTMKSSWSWMFSSEIKRGTVFNFALMIPTLVMFGRVVTKEFQQGVTAMDIALNKESSETTSSNIIGGLEPAFTAFLTCFTVTLLGYFVVLCSYLDDASTINWKSYQIRHVGENRIMMYNTAIALFLFYCTAAYSCNSILSACGQWILLASSSFLMPSVVAVVSIASAGETGTHDIKMAGRMTLPVLFALRHSLLVVMCGMLPSLDAISVAYLLWDKIEFLRNVIKTRDIVFVSVPNEVYVAYISLRLAMMTSDIVNKRPVEWVDTLVATVSLLLIHELTSSMATISARLGAWTTDLAVREQRRPASIRHSFVGIGLAVFGSWLFMIMLLAVT